MNTQYNKAVLAFLIPLITLANQKWGIALPVDEATLGALLAAVTGIVVYLVPNKKEA